MINISVIAVGRVKEKYYADAVSEYIKRLSAYCKLQVVEIPEDRQQSLEKEKKAIEAKLPTGAMIVALCVEGSQSDSRGLSEMLSECAVKGVSKICFLIGGSVGLHEELKSRADVRLSMSKMTFTHSLARVMLLEQIYRAFNISQGGKYHK